MIKIGLIGLGFIGKTHLQNSLKLPNSRTVAVSDVSKKALLFARELGIKKTVTDYRQLVGDPNIDAVVISLPTYLHASCALEAAQSGKDIFLEKPLARNVEEGERIVSAAKRHGVKLMVGYVDRFNPSFIRLKQEIQSGRLGEVRIAYGTSVSSGPFFHRAETGIPSPVPNWWFDKELTGGGALIDLGCYLVNLFRWYFGEFIDIKCHLGHRFNMDVEDKATCIATLGTGVVAIINVGWFSQENREKIELLGTVRHANASYFHQNRIMKLTQLFTKTFFKYSPHFIELEHFANCIEHDIQPITSGEDALKDLEVISLAYENKMIL
jgi:predicted dehydrogenase